MAIVWRDKLVAFGIHFIATALLAATAAALIFGVWFPDPFNDMIGGTKLFELVVGCDLALGPLISLVIFNRGKSRRELFIDYTIVGIVQIAALSYGVWVMAASRPVYVAFSKDRFEVVMPQNVRDADLAAALDPQYKRLPLTGPIVVAVNVPAAAQSDVLFQELEGHGGQTQPKFFVPYESQLDVIRQHAGTVADLEKRHKNEKAVIEAAVAKAGIPATRLRWLPVAVKGEFWTALIDFETGKPVSYAQVDPY
jgi:hypothetical protein